MLQILEKKLMGQGYEVGWLEFLCFFVGNDEVLICEDNSSIEGSLGCFRKKGREKLFGVLEDERERRIYWGKEVVDLHDLQLHFIPCFLLYFASSVKLIN